MEIFKNSSQVQFEIYNLDGNHIESMSDPNDFGYWIQGLDSPPEMAIFPVPFESIDMDEFGEDLFKVVCSKYDDRFNDIPYSREEIIMLVDYSKEKSAQIAKDQGFDYFYFIE